jgi:RNA polymerase sigma-70 factor (ECF subfamily)
MISMMSSEAILSGFAEFLAAHTALLKSLYARAKAGNWEIPSEEFAAALHRSAARHFGAGQATPQALEEYLGALHLEDLALACALRRASEPAWERFVSDYRPILRAAARAIVGAGAEDRAHELADSLYAELYGLDRSGGERQSSLFDYFHGRSKLSTWLRSVLAQRYVDGLRASQRLQPLEEENNGRWELGLQRSTAESEKIDPDRARLLPLLADAVSEALAASPAPDRLLLMLYYVQGVTLAQIARMRNVHEATISRRLQSIRGELRERIELMLATGRTANNGRAAANGLSTEEIRLCMSYALEDWPFDLAPTLMPNGAPGTREGK